MKSKNGFGIYVSLIFLVSFCSSQAAVQPANLFTDGTVLQRDMKIPVWGKAKPGGEIRVRFAGQESKAKVGQDGKWIVKIGPFHASAEGRPLEIEGDGAVKIFKDVLVGEVWVCSGQSNMQYTKAQTEDGLQAVPEATDNQLRWFARPATPKKARETWLPTSPELAKRSSAVAYFFGKHLRENEGVPVGLIVRAVGGTTIQRWTPSSAVKEGTLLHSRVTEAQANAAEIDKAAKEKKNYSKRKKPSPEVAQWLSKMSRLEAYRYNIGGLYQRQIKPLQPYAIRGVIWYQGEFNNRPGQAHDYRELQTGLIDEWRNDWEQGDFPFLFVQLQVLGNATTTVFRESQAMTLNRVKNTAMAVICDQSIGLHPPKKRIAGERLGMAARELVGEKDEGGRAPELVAHETRDGAMWLSFRHVGTGLEMKEKPASGFVISGGDGEFVGAEAELVGNDQVKVWAASVPNPVDVRYAWMNDPREAMPFYNSQGIPVPPFRTDTEGTPDEMLKEFSRLKPR